MICKFLFMLMECMLPKAVDQACRFESDNWRRKLGLLIANESVTACIAVGFFVVFCFIIIISFVLL